MGTVQTSDRTDKKFQNFRKLSHNFEIFMKVLCKLLKTLCRAFYCLNLYTSMSTSHLYTTDIPLPSRATAVHSCHHKAKHLISSPFHSSCFHSIKKPFVHLPKLFIIFPLPPPFPKTALPRLLKQTPHHTTQHSTPSFSLSFPSLHRNPPHATPQHVCHNVRTPSLFHRSDHGSLIRLLRLRHRLGSRGLPKTHLPNGPRQATRKAASTLVGRSASTPPWPVAHVASERRARSAAGRSPAEQSVRARSGIRQWTSGSKVSLCEELAYSSDAFIIFEELIIRPVRT